MRGMMRNLPKLEHVMVPVLVLGDQRDGTVSIEELHSTARAYRTTAEVFPNMGHDMMLEPGWATVAERIHNWLTASGLWPRNDALDADLQPALRVTDRHAAPGPSNPLLIIQQQLICSHCRFSPPIASHNCRDLRFSMLSHAAGGRICLTNRFISYNVRDVAAL